MKIESRIVAIGDIHGCYDELIQLIGKLNIQPDDHVIFLGDYIDRGPKSLEVIEYLIQFKQDYKNSILLVGNHEIMFLNALKGIDVDLFLYNGGHQTARSFGIDSFERFFPDKKQMRLLKFFDGLKSYYETENFIFVHAGLRPSRPLERQSLEDLTWIREEFLNAKTLATEKVVIHGHTPYYSPRVQLNKIGIDTCCFKTHVLTGIEFPHGDDTAREGVKFYNTSIVDGEEVK